MESSHDSKTEILTYNNRSCRKHTRVCFFLPAIECFRPQNLPTRPPLPSASGKKICQRGYWVDLHFSWARIERFKVRDVMAFFHLWRFHLVTIWRWMVSVSARWDYLIYRLVPAGWSIWFLMTTGVVYWYCIMLKVCGELQCQVAEDLYMNVILVLQRWLNQAVFFKSVI